MDDVWYTDNKLTIDGTDILPPHKIKDIIEVDDRVIVLQDPSVDVDDEEKNIIAFDGNGNRLWTVESPTTGFRTPYTYTQIEFEDGHLIANN
jgi:hypothetical protein